MRLSKTFEREEIHSHTDADGNYTEERTTVTTKLKIDDEPDFIKLYTRMWLEFNNIPERYRQLFFSLICRMTYCQGSTGQLVYTLPPSRDEIIKECGWTQRDSLVKGLKALCACNAIRRVGRGVYQINPKYAGRGEWKYNPKLERGGIKDLIATFNFADGDISTDIIWGDDGKDNGINDFYRDALDVSPKQEAVLSDTKVEKDSHN